MRVLIADDSKVMRSMLTDWVVSMGYDVLVASNGGEAVDVAQHEDFDIAIIDWEMPKRNGIQVVEILRGNPRTAYAHIILITASDNDDFLIQALEGGADDFVPKPFARATLLARLRAAARIVNMRQEILTLASTDMLTGAANRRSFMERASQHLMSAQRRACPICVLASDIDFFKNINDTYGHAGGDAALKTFVSTCSRMLRPLDLIGRVGGEEFAFLLPDTRLPGAVSVGERLRAAVASLEIPFDDRLIRMTVSFGAAEVETGIGSIEPALIAADTALYRAKENGRNRVEQAA